MTIQVRPCTRAAARAYVAKHHSHHRPHVTEAMRAAAWIGEEMVGVVVLEYPNAPALNDGVTWEVTRLCCRGGDDNVASRLLGAAWRAGHALGCERMVSYTRIDEPGTCYAAAGWWPVASVKGREWTTGNKAQRWIPGLYEPSSEIVDRVRWEKVPGHRPGNALRELSLLLAGRRAA
jgi:hypothetical protein